MSEDDKPEWWVNNEEIREYYELPPYTPPRFKDGEYTHTVVDGLESKLGCTIQFVGMNTSYRDKWEVRINRDPRFTIPRHRDKNGNTVYEMTSGLFVEMVESSVNENG